MSRASTSWIQIVLVTVLALSASSVWALHANEGAELLLAEADGMSLSIKGSILAVGGEARELVYAGHGQSVPSDYEVSELIWDITSLWMVGGTLSARFPKNFTINAGMWFGLNAGSGDMEDRDWLDPSTSSWTHFSQSDVDIESAFSLDINGVLHLFDVGRFDVGVIGGFKYNFWDWSDFNGFYIYSDSGFRDDSGTFEARSGIEYEQTFYIPYMGIQASTAGSGIRATAYLLYSPSVWAEDKDFHILRDLHFREEFEGGNFFAGGAEVTIDVTDALFISGAVDVQIIPEFTGDLYQTEGDNGVETKSPDGAGIENSVSAVSLSAGLRF
jgi:plasminogen activator